jgi:multidrug efflux pump subunit AcrB
LRPIERELSAVKNVLYFESSADDTSGTASITVTFKPGTDAELAQVDVQNRVKSVEPRLPEQVRRSWPSGEAASSGFPDDGLADGRMTGRSILSRSTTIWPATCVLN